MTMESITSLMEAPQSRWPVCHGGHFHHGLVDGAPGQAGERNAPCGPSTKKPSVTLAVETKVTVEKMQSAVTALTEAIRGMGGRNS